MRIRIAIALAACCGIAAADTIDAPTPRAHLRGTARVSGSITRDAAYPAHLYTARHDGFARIVLATTSTDPHANHGHAWRKYLRVVSGTNAHRRGDGWSTNGRGDRAELLVRVHAGDELTIVATLAENVAKGVPAATADYALAVTEEAP